MTMVKTYNRQVKVFQVKVSGKFHEMEEHEARQLFEELRKELGEPFPNVKWSGCDDRFSHGPHAELKDGVIYYCNGRSFDAT